MDKAIKVGDLACFYVCGERYEHTVTVLMESGSHSIGD